MTQGWRPISRKIQPKEQAMKGSHMVASAAFPRSVREMRRPERVSHRARTPRPIEAIPSPIMRRKDQKLTMTLGL